MRKTTTTILLIIATLINDNSSAQNNIFKTEGYLNNPWVFKINFLNTPMERVFTFIMINGKLNAVTANNDTIAVVLDKNKISIIQKAFGSILKYYGTFDNSIGKGVLHYFDSEDNLNDSVIVNFEAIKMNLTNPNNPKQISIIPKIYQRSYNNFANPIAHIWPGDSIHTETIDAGGTDKRGIIKSLGGNPLTGPFFVETALPGDVIAITINKLSLNRDWAITNENFISRSVDNNYYKKTNASQEIIKWHLDTLKNTAWPLNPHTHLKNFIINLHPMLGCIGTASRGEVQSLSSGDSGPFGGNLDFNEITEGATLLLPVSTAGAYLYLGDAHALQGDGEINQNALETSMNVGFTVDVIKGSKMNLKIPRLENSKYRMSIGLKGSLDEALKQATSDLANWIAKDYSLSDEETAEVLGTTIEYNINEIADRNVGVVAKIKKEFLSKLKK